MYRVLVSALVALLGLSTGASAMSLNEAVRRAVETSPEVLEAGADARAIGAAGDQARALYMPTLDVEGSVGGVYVDRPNSLRAQDNREWRLGRQVSVVARWTLFDGFYRANEMFRQATLLEGAGYRIFEAAEIVALQAIEAYVDVLRHRRVLAAADRNIAQHRYILAQAQTQYDGGVATRGEVEIAGERLASAEAMRAEVMRALGEVEASFIRLVGVAPERLARPRLPDALPRSLEAAISLARERHPSLDAAALDVEANEAQAEQETSSIYPTVALEGRGTLGYDLNGTPGPSNEASVRLTMSWRLYDGGLRQARYRERLERTTAAQIRLDRARRDIDQGVRRAWTGLVANEERMAALHRRLTQAERVVAAYHEEYDAGLRSLLDILDAQNARFNAEFEVASVEAISVFARWQLLGSTGGLLHAFGLQAMLPDLEERREDLRLHTTSGGLLEPLFR
ncbi:MAG: TolC family outer membrane protein [Hyphomicrobiaceae bacterium]|nr:TolC family outer membrane protein [Hyphomicrobiaceae bacterium]